MSALLRLVLITAVAVMVVFFGLIGLRTVGSMQSYSSPHHPWVGHKFSLILDGGCSIEELKRTHAQHPQAINRITIKLSNHESWVVDCAQEYPIRDLVQALPSLSFLFNVQAKSDYGLAELGRDLKSLENNLSIGIESQSHVVAKQLRKEFPQWVFGADPTSLVKIHLFESLFIEPLADMWPDFFVVSTRPTDTEYISPRLLSELVKRKKLIYWKDDASSSELPDFLDSQLNGVLTNRPTWALEKYSSRF